MMDRLTFLKEYDGPPLNLMEVCGTHTAEISHNGIPSMLSPNIRLISGPGCPVCVTVTAYIDKLIELAKDSRNVIVTFGDMLRVSGRNQSLSDIRAEGAQVRMVYSPLDILKLAGAEPDKTFIFAAVGFETTTAVYAMLMQEILSRGIRNIRLLTSLKTMPPVINWVCREQGGVDGFLAPGHVSVVTGSAVFNGLAEKYTLPFAVAGFEGPQLLAAIYALVKARGQGKVMNLYPSVVTERGNVAAQQAIARYFMPTDAAWRGMGVIAGSGLILRPEYAAFDAGSADLTDDHAHNPQCRCAQVLTGAIKPTGCPLFGRECTPQSQQGACMVSTEGSCYNYYVNNTNPSLKPI